MDILVSVLFALAGPTFMVIGLVVFLKWLARGGGSLESATRKVIAKELRERAWTKKGEAKAALLEAAESLEGVLLEAPAAKPETAPAGAAAAVRHAAPSPGRAAAKSSWTQLDVTAALHNLDNINLLLYLGAFLIVVSAGIFVGYNFSTLSGAFKTVFLGAFATAFYVVGIFLYLRSSKLRPAGSTFTGIGLVLVPLVGLAAYNFTFLHDHASSLWFATSLISLIMYVTTLALIRQTYIAYLMAFTTLSLFESGISLVNLPVYWFGWGMGAVALLMMALSRWTGWWEDAAESLNISANIFVPVSLLLSVLLWNEHGLGQLGVTIGLAGLFYLLMAARNRHTQAGQVYWLLALAAVPAALGIGLWDHVSHGGVAAMLMVVAGAYLAIGVTERAALGDKWTELLGLTAGLLPLFAAVIEFQSPVPLLLIVLGAVVINGVFALALRQSTLALLAVVAALFVPFVYGRDVLDPAAGWGWVAAMYLLLAGPLVVWRREMRGWPQSGDAVGVFGYMMALIIALVAAAVSSSTALLVTGAAVAAALFGLSYLEDRADYVYLSSAALYLALFQIVAIRDLNTGAYAVIFLLTGAGLYLAGSADSGEKRSQPLRYSGLAGPFLGAMVGLNGDHMIEPILSLAAGGGLLWVEAARQKLETLEEAAVAVLLLAFDWYLAYASITQTQIFSLPWAAYFAYLAYRRRDRGHEQYDLLTILALAALTFPIAGQALSDTGQLYGLELIFIALGLVFGGFSLRYKLVTWWGAATLVGEVLYQLRDFLYGLPKYVISAALGLALLAVAIVMLQRRKPNP